MNELVKQLLKVAKIDPLFITGVHYATEGDGKPIVTTLKDANGPVNLSEVTVWFSATETLASGEITVLVEGEAQVLGDQEDPDFTGKVAFAPVSSWPAPPSNWKTTRGRTFAVVLCEWEATFPGDPLPRTFPDGPFKEVLILGRQISSAT